jgi:hypothetical protein
MIGNTAWKNPGACRFEPSIACLFLRFSCRSGGLAALTFIV